MGGGFLVGALEFARQGEGVAGLEVEVEDLSVVQEHGHDDVPAGLVPDLVVADVQVGTGGTHAFPFSARRAAT